LLRLRLLTQYRNREFGAGFHVSVSKCVLIVDDHAEMRKALRSLFSSNGFEVCGEAVDGHDAIEKAQELSPDLILLDLSMPVMKGLEAARELSKLLPDVPLMMITNHVGKIMEQEAHSAGIRAIVSKNDLYDKLMNQARELLD
jgi:two-component system chemotaxis response regulator CheY